MPLPPRQDTDALQAYLDRHLPQPYLIQTPHGPMALKLLDDGKAHLQATMGMIETPFRLDGKGYDIEVSLRFTRPLPGARFDLVYQERAHHHPMGWSGDALPCEPKVCERVLDIGWQVITDWSRENGHVLAAWEALIAAKKANRIRGEIQTLQEQVRERTSALESAMANVRWTRQQLQRAQQALKVAAAETGADGVEEDDYDPAP